MDNIKQAIVKIDVFIDALLLENKLAKERLEHLETKYADLYKEHCKDEQ